MLKSSNLGKTMQPAQNFTICGSLVSGQKQTDRYCVEYGWIADHSREMPFQIAGFQVSINRLITTVYLALPPFQTLFPLYFLARNIPKRMY